MTLQEWADRPLRGPERGPSVRPSASSGKIGGPLPHLPIVKHRDFSVSSGRLDRIQVLAARLLRSDERIRATHSFHANVQIGLGRWPTLHVHDRPFDPSLPEIRFGYQHRALLLAGGGDLVAVSQAVSRSFVAYCRDVLGLGAPTVLRSAAVPRRSAFASLMRDPQCLARIVDAAASHGGLNVLPYIGCGGAWALAGLVAERAGVQVRVGAPRPLLSAAVNHKVWFTEIARELLGSSALPVARSAQSWTGLIRLLTELSESHETLGLKLPSTSGSVGNLVLESKTIRGVPLRRLMTRMKELLTGLGWARPFPLLVTVWEAPVLVSPSVQMWIPLLDRGPPVLEGVFDQKVTGPEGAFFGCSPTRLPESWLESICREAAMLATLFQAIGYYGRCSFDAILVGGDLSEASLHWVECNGRWGGTSIPMTLANRLVGDYGRRPFVTTGKVPVSAEEGFESVLRLLEGRLWGTPAGGNIILIGPGLDASCSHVDMLAFGDTVEAAEEEIRLATAVLASKTDAATIDYIR